MSDLSSILGAPFRGNPGESVRELKSIRLLNVEYQIFGAGNAEILRCLTIEVPSSEKHHKKQNLAA
jgi:hypothetical protein